MSKKEEIKLSDIDPDFAEIKEPVIVEEEAVAEPVKASQEFVEKKDTYIVSPEKAEKMVFSGEGRHSELFSEVVFLGANRKVVLALELASIAVMPGGVLYISKEVNVPLDFLVKFVEVKSDHAGFIKLHKEIKK